MKVAAAKRDLSPMMSSGKSTWRTPENILELVRTVADGDIALDVATSKDNPCGAVRFYTPTENGLLKTWYANGLGGLAYCNPPYGRQIGHWTAKAVTEAASDARIEIVMLLPARPDTVWWQRDVRQADAVCFWKGRIKFVGAKAGAPFPSAVVYFGDRVKAFRRVFAPHGWVVGRG